VQALCSSLAPMAAPLLLRALSNLRASVDAAREAAGEAAPLSDEAGMLELQLLRSPADWTSLARLGLLVSQSFRASSFARKPQAGAAAALATFAHAIAYAGGASNHEIARQLMAMDAKYSVRGVPSAAFLLFSTQVVGKPLLGIDFDGIKAAHFSTTTGVLVQPLLEAKVSEMKGAATIAPDTGRFSSQLQPLRPQSKSSFVRSWSVPCGARRRGVRTARWPQ
jgi:hypothetical protein